MPDAATFFAFQQKAAALVVTAVLVVSALVGDGLVDKSLLGQPLQLPVHGGQADGLTLPVQLLCQLRGGGAALRAGLDALQHRPLLPCHIGNGHVSHLQFENENRFQIIAGKQNLSSRQAERMRFLATRH